MKNYDKHLEHGTLVSFTLPEEDFKRNGRIVGVASNGVPVLGITYIIKPIRKLEHYPYDCFSLTEAQFEVVGQPHQVGVII